MSSTACAVVELAGDPAGEMLGKLLAELGADVVKVEPPEGSPTRAIGPFADDRDDADHSLTFWYYNTNKRSVVLDDRDRPTGRDLLGACSPTPTSASPRWRRPRLRALGLEPPTLADASDRAGRRVDHAVRPRRAVGRPAQQRPRRPRRSAAR